MNCQEIIYWYLDVWGFDGLCNTDISCGCGKDELCPCGSELGNCKPAYRCNCKHDYDDCNEKSECYSTEKMDRCWRKMEEEK